MAIWSGIRNKLETEYWAERFAGSDFGCAGQACGQKKIEGYEGDHCR